MTGIITFIILIIIAFLSLFCSYDVGSDVGHTLSKYQKHNNNYYDYNKHGKHFY